MFFSCDLMFLHTLNNYISHDSKIHNYPNVIKKYSKECQKNKNIIGIQ